MATKKHTLKLFVDTRSNKVLFAEAGNEMADFFFELFALPVGSVVKLLSKRCMIGSLGELYGSLESLSDTYIQPGQNKATFLNPPVFASLAKSNTLLIQDGSSSCAPKHWYNCGSSGSTCSRLYHTDVYGTQCPNCRGMMTYELKNIGSGSNVVTDGSGGLVKEVVTYMVMDDLAIMPLSTISIITLLNKFNVKEVGSLQETVVELGMDEGLKLLRASLQSKTVLTDVFLVNKK
ncbi:hypothetical protein QJS04_geneDACA022807 [Acorus gramineus]|uniref:DUF674 domain-containing protein n=1 Tax=Acorus gramineus TaxID=55184 RepID=A0AAV9B1P5_ACOGR|nr:hypothetical protein QJS04_geneDACA022807 [Acorus gramineus]